LADKRDQPDVDVEIVMGELGCGDLVYELREQFERVQPGQVVRVLSNDPGGPRDIPAWCGMTGRALLAADPPTYIIQERKELP
jgi:tRNA 2-thiouridine synthesizing protein A